MYIMSEITAILFLLSNSTGTRPRLVTVLIELQSLNRHLSWAPLFSDYSPYKTSQSLGRSIVVMPFQTDIISNGIQEKSPGFLGWLESQVK